MLHLLSHNPHSHLRRISTLFTPADREQRRKEGKGTTQREREREGKEGRGPLSRRFPFFSFFLFSFYFLSFFFFLPHSSFLPVFPSLCPFSSFCTAGVTRGIRDFLDEHRPTSYLSLPPVCSLGCTPSGSPPCVHHLPFLSLSFLYLSLPIERILGQTISLSTGPAMKRWITGKGKGEEEEEEEREREKKKNIDRKHAVSARCCNRCNAIAISASETAIRSRPIKGAAEGREDGRGGRGNTLEFFSALTCRLASTRVGGESRK